MIHTEILNFWRVVLDPLSFLSIALIGSAFYLGWIVLRSAYLQSRNPNQKDTEL